MNASVRQRAVVSVSNCPHSDYVCVRVAGDIDITTDEILTAAIDKLRILDHPAVCVDLADVGFAGSTLLTFLARIIASTPQHKPVLLYRPPDLIRRLIHMARFDTVATVCDELPEDPRAPTSQR